MNSWHDLILDDDGSPIRRTSIVSSSSSSSSTCSSSSSDQQEEDDIKPQQEEKQPTGWSLKEGERKIWNFKILSLISWKGKSVMEISDQDLLLQYVQLYGLQALEKKLVDWRLYKTVMRDLPLIIPL